MENKRGLLIVMSGPSGVGKGTIRQELFKSDKFDFAYSISMTTRKMREGEVNGRDYYFVTKDEFENRIKDGKFLEYAEFVGNYYGTPLDKVNEMRDSGKEVFLEIEVEGAMQVKKKVPDCVLIFILPPTKEDLYKRLRKRGTETEEVIQDRIAKSNKEFKVIKNYDYIVVNDDINTATNKILSIIEAEHLKTSHSLDEYKEFLED